MQHFRNENSQLLLIHSQVLILDMIPASRTWCGIHLTSDPYLLDASTTPASSLITCASARGGAARPAPRATAILTRLVRGARSNCCATARSRAATRTAAAPRRVLRSARWKRRWRPRCAAVTARSSILFFGSKNLRPRF